MLALLITVVVFNTSILLILNNKLLKVMLSPYLDKLNEKRIVLASGSIARKKILEQAGLKIEVSPSSFEENLGR